MKTNTLTTLAALLVSIAGADSALGQSATNEMWLRGNALATRERLDREVRVKRHEGVIKPWSPDTLVFPLRPDPHRPAEADAAAPPRD